MPPFDFNRRLSRRTLLRGAGVGLALPLLDAMLPSAFGKEPDAPRRMVIVYTDMGLMPNLFFPQQAGRDYELSPYLNLLGAFRSEMTVFSGVSHPQVDGGHQADHSYLTGAMHPGQSNFRNSISLDQFAAEKIGSATRFATLNLRVGDTSTGLSWTRAGVLVPPEKRPSVVFRQMFLQGDEQEVQARLRQLREGRSLLDMLADSRRGLHRSLGPDDQRRVDQYFSSVRDLEQQMAKAEEWERKPKAKVDAQPPADIEDQHDTIGRSRLMFDMIRLALQTDSSRIITLMIQDFGPNHHLSEQGHHDLTHHGSRPESIAILRKIEEGQLRAFGDFLASLKNVAEGNQTLLDRTMVLHGAGMGDANVHSNDNLPTLLVGGGFKHGQHLAFDTHRNYELANLFVSMLQQLGIEADRFSTSTGTMRGLEMNG